LGRPRNPKKPTMTNYSVTLVQTDIIWENPEANLRNYETLIRSYQKPTDALLLPEMFTTGFSMNSKQFAEGMDGNSVSWMKQLAKDTGAAVGGSLIIKEDQLIYNRFIWAKPEGTLKYYDKRHLFFLERESNAYAPGNQRIIVAHKGLRILLATCYDLRFPVWLRNRNDYDAIFLIANWPSARKEVWIKLLYARAIENQCYVAAVNRIGTDGNGLTYSGESVIINPKGNIMQIASLTNEESVTVDLDLNELSAFRKKFPVWLDADDFDLKYK
jgi:omega-amidase